MMAFFLLHWLLNATTEDQTKAISNYFAPASVSESTSGAGGVLGGRTFGEGALPSKGGAPAVFLAVLPTSHVAQREGVGGGEYRQHVGRLHGGVWSVDHGVAR